MNSCSPKDQAFTSDPEKWLSIIVELLQRTGPASVPDILRHCQLMDEQLVPILMKGVKSALISHSNGMYGVVNQQSNAMWALTSRMFHPHEVMRRSGDHYSHWMARLRDLADGRPPERTLYRQRHVTLRTSLLRAFYLFYRGDLHNRRIVLLGDDDLTSIAVALVSGFHDMVVLEVDEELVEFLRSRIAVLDVPNVDVRVYDAWAEPPTDLVGTADTFLCDPSRRLYDLFLDRGLSFLRSTGSFYCFVNPSHSSSDGQFIFQREALARGWIITDSIPAFNEYRRHPDTLDESLSTAYAAPADDEDTISFTESLVRFVKGPGLDVEAEIRKNLHERKVFGG